MPISGSGTSSSHRPGSACALTSALTARAIVGAHRDGPWRRSAAPRLPTAVAHAARRSGPRWERRASAGAGRARCRRGSGRCRSRRSAVARARPSRGRPAPPRRALHRAARHERHRLDGVAVRHRLVHLAGGVVRLVRERHQRVDGLRGSVVALRARVRARPAATSRAIAGSRAPRAATLPAKACNRSQVWWVRKMRASGTPLASKRTSPCRGSASRRLAHRLWQSTTTSPPGDLRGDGRQHPLGGVVAPPLPADQRERDRDHDREGSHPRGYRQSGARHCRDCPRTRTVPRVASTPPARCSGSRGTRCRGRMSP